MLVVGGSRPSWRRTTILAAAAVCIALSSPAAGQAGAGSSAPAKRLSSTELEALLAGGARFRALPIGVGLGTSRREYFHSTGEYEGCGDRLEVFGKFSVKRNALCIAAQDGTSCREVFQSPTGEYFERFGDARAPLSVEISESKGESCRTVGVTP
jgi:hypothetical protein